MLEPLLVSAEPPAWIDTSVPDVKAAVMRTEHGILVLPMWMGAGSQFVPGQAAAARLEIRVPQVPNGGSANAAGLSHRFSRPAFLFGAKTSAES